ncbi:hypothetical protein Btru_038471, partial [Bulinus truncatus]
MDFKSRILNLEVDVRKSDINFYIEPSDQIPGIRHSLLCYFIIGPILSVHIYKRYQVTPVNISSTNTAVYTFAPLQCQDMGTYSCVVQMRSGETRLLETDIKIDY